MSRFAGSGIVNTLINKLPFELHLPTYMYCGPGTRLEERLARGDPGKNPLDVACMQHDIAYANNKKDIALRNKADKVLAGEAWKRVTAKDSSVGEKVAALGVAGIMKIKRKLGMGVKSKKKKYFLKKIINVAQKSLNKKNFR